MSADALTPRPTAGPDWAPLDRAIARFEQACWQGASPRIEDYLLEFSAAAERLALLRELVHIDLELRWTSPHSLTAAEYLARFPVLAHDAALESDLIASE